MSDYCLEHKIVLGKICLIDNEVEKLQSCRENSILSSGYSAEDILGLPHKKTGSVRDEDWQRAYMDKLGTMVINLLDNAEDVPVYLASGKVPADHLPEDLLPLIESKKVQQEEVKSVIMSQFDYDSYLTQIPKGTKFLRFTTLPKTIVYEFVMKDLPFFMELDKNFKEKGKATY